MFDSLLILASAAQDAAAATGGNPITEIASQFGVDWAKLGFQTLNFVVVAGLMYFLAFKPVLATLEERQTKIAEGLKYAEEMKAKLADAERQHQEVLKQASLEAQRIVHEARDTAKALVEKATKEASTEAEQILKKGNEAIALERQQMLNDVRREVARLVVDTTSKVLDRTLSEPEKKTFAEAAAKEIYSKN